MSEHFAIGSDSSGYKSQPLALLEVDMILRAFVVCIKILDEPFCDEFAYWVVPP
ncbi:MAG TPA: hypothetical protein VFW96_14495 [Thermomicrobiales bacterium]|nr:hypothetical protein [Thermomicrobiales bacterium]